MEQNNDRALQHRSCDTSCIVLLRGRAARGAAGAGRRPQWGRAHLCVVEHDLGHVAETSEYDRRVLLFALLVGLEEYVAYEARVLTQLKA